MLFHLFLSSIFVAVPAIGSSMSTAVVNVGHNTTLSCFNSTLHHKTNPEQVCWRWSGLADPGHQSVQKQDGSLFLQNVTVKNSGTYTCHDQRDDSIIRTYKVLVPGPPSSPTNLTATEVDDVIILKWHNTYTKDYLEAAPNTALRIHYRPLVHSNGTSHYNTEPRQPWRVLRDKLDPTRNTVIISEIKQSSNYQFEVWAENKHGTSQIATVTTSAKHISAALHSNDADWEYKKHWLLLIVTLLSLANVVAVIAWLLHYDNKSRKRRRHCAIGNHSGLSRECEQLELVCHAHNQAIDSTSTSQPHLAAIV